MARASVDDPIKVFRFKVYVEDFVRAGFSELSGVDRTVEVVNYREGGMNDTVQKSPGLTTFPDITLRRGQIFGNSGGTGDFYVWMSQVFTLSGNGNAGVFRKTIEIVQVNHANAEVARWRIVNAFPVGYKPFSDLNGQTNENSVEELRIAHEGWELITRLPGVGGAI